MRGSWVALLVTAQALVWTGVLHADAGTQYPASQLSVSVSRNARANSVVTVTFSGTNAVFTQGAPVTYTLDAFVQARSALPSCPASYGEELNNYANLAGRSIIRIATNLNEGVSGPFRFNVKYRSGTTRRIVICAYSRLITDDAAHAQLRKTLRPARH
jgi:hypothetical protein